MDNFKEKRLHQELEGKDEDRFNDITRLNNELVNAQRLIAKMNRQLEEKNEILNALVIHDPLTGLFNRQYLKTKFTEMRSIQERMDVNVVMVMIDLNDFKLVNDTYGHEAGDRLLADFANTARMLTRKDFDFVFRIGGDEFVLLMMNCVLEEAEEICERLSGRLESMSDIVTLSYGAVYIKCCEDLPHYIDEADKKMYALKRKLKGQRVQ